MKIGTSGINIQYIQATFDSEVFKVSLINSISTGLRELPQLHSHLPSSYMPGKHLNQTYMYPCLTSDQAERQGAWAFFS